MKCLFHCVHCDVFFQTVTVPTFHCPCSHHGCRVFAGYYAARLYKTMKGTLWKRAAFQVRHCPQSLRLCLDRGFLCEWQVWSINCRRKLIRIYAEVWTLVLLEIECECF